LQLGGDIIENLRVLSDLIMFQDDLLRVASVVCATMAKRGIPR
jgi:hypothetical protein